MAPEQPTPQQLQIKVLDNDLKGIYSNLMQIVHTKEEFIFDFFFNAPPQGILASRVILNPAHAKRMAMALAENVKKYEEHFGKIAETEMPEEKIGFIK
jgi:hypothetical protein